MILNRITKIAIALTAAVLLAAVVFYVYFFHFYLPGHLRRQVLPELLGDAGLDGFSGELRRVGTMGADLGELVIGNKENPALHIRSVGIQYRLRDFLWTNRLSISNINFRGVELKCRLSEDGRLAVNGLDIEDVLSFSGKYFGDKRWPQIAKLLSDTTITVRDGVLVLDGYGEQLTAPFSLKIASEGKEWSKPEIAFKLQLPDQEVVGKVLFDPATGEARIGVGSEVKLAQALRFAADYLQFKTPSGLVVNGNVTVEGEFNLKLKPLQPGNFNLKGTIGAGELKYNGFWLRNRLLPSGRKIPMILHITRNDGRLAARLEDGLLYKPLPVMMKELNIDIPSDKVLPVLTSGTFAVDLTQFRFLQNYGIQPAGETGVEKRFRGRFNRVDNAWHFNTESRVDTRRQPTLERYVFSRDDMNFFCDFSNLEISGSGIGFAGNLDFRGNIDALNVVAEKTAFSGKKGNFQTSFKLTADKSGELSTGENSFKCYLPEFFYFTDEHRLTANKLQLNGKTISTDDNPVAMRLELECDDFIARGERDLLSGSRFSVISDLTKSPRDSLWHGQLNLDSEKIVGRHDVADFDVRGVSVKSSITVSSPALTSETLRAVKARVRLSDGGYRTETSQIRLENADLGLSMVFSQTGGRLLDKTLTGDVDVIRWSHQNNSLTLWKSRLFGTLKRGESLVDAAADSDFLERLEVDKMEFSTPDVRLIAGSGTLRIEGQMQPDRLFPVKSKLSVFLPTLWALGKDTKVRAEQVAADLTAGFTSASSIKTALREAAFSLNSSEVSGNYGDRDFSGKTVNLLAKAKINSTDPASDGVAVENFVGEGGVTKFALAAPAGDVELDKLMLTCQTDSDAKSGDLRWHPTAIGKQLRAAWNGYRAVSPEISLKGYFDGNGFSGKLKVNQGQISYDKGSLTLSETGSRVPLVFDSASLNLNHKGTELAFDGEFHSPLLAVNPVIRGGITLPLSPLRWYTSFIVPRHTISEPFQAGHYFPEFEGLSFKGTSTLHGELSGNEEKVTSSQMSIKLENSELRFRDWLISGVSGFCRFDNLMELRSAPRQRFTFRHLEHQQYNLEDGSVNLQIEAPETVYIEHAKFNWLGGEVRSLSPFYISVDPNETAAVFQADNLQPEPLFKLLRLGGTASETTLSGKLRPEIIHGKLRLVNADLAAESGASGRLQLPEISRFANPAETNPDAMNNLEFVQEALRDFQYKWLRLYLNEQESCWDVQLKTGGSPAKPIPFKFDATSKLFVRTRSGDPQFSRNVVVESDFRLPKE